MKKVLLLLSLFAMVAFYSCDGGNDDLDKKDYDKKDYDKKTCFELVYPVTYIMPDGSMLSGDKEEVYTALELWYEGNPDVAQKPELQYPVEITFDGKDDYEGETITIDDIVEMKKAKDDCYKDKKDCYEFVYPVSAVMPDGSIVIGSDDETFWDNIKAWYEAHPDSEEKFEFQYPLEVDDDGMTTTINNAEEMDEIEEDCYDKKENCFDFVYPISVIMPDGSIVTGDKETLWDGIKTWYEANPDSEEKFELQYPVDIVDEEGAVTTLSDDAALIAAKEDCYGDDE